MADPPAVRPYRDDDLPDVLDVLRAALGEPPGLRRTPQLFRWKHIDNPFGRSIMLVAELDGRIAGFRAFMRWRLMTPDGSVLECGRAVDTSTHPDFQRRGVFRALTEVGIERAAEEGIDLEYVWGEVSWFLPHGVTQECLHCTPWACPMDDSLFQPVFVPGYYQVWIWNDSGRGGDYNLSMGIGEEGETCEGLAHTIDLYQQIVSDELFVLPHCVSAGISGFETCEMPAW